MRRPFGGCGPGERLDVTDGEGRIAECVVASVGQGAARARRRRAATASLRPSHGSSWSRRWSRASVRSSPSNCSPRSASTRSCRGRRNACVASWIARTVRAALGAGRARGRQAGPSTVVARGRQKQRRPRGVRDRIASATLARCCTRRRPSALTDVLAAPAGGRGADRRRARGRPHRRGARRLRRRWCAPVRLGPSVLAGQHRRVRGGRCGHGGDGPMGMNAGIELVEPDDGSNEQCREWAARSMRRQIWQLISPVSADAASPKSSCPARTTW